MIQSAEKLLIQPAGTPLHVAILALEDSNLLSLAATVDPMRAANRRAAKRLFDWSFHTAAGPQSALTAGFSLPGTPIAALARADLLIVVAGFNLARHGTPALFASLRRLAPQCRAMAGVDGGGWILAQAGLLDGHSATTHWEDLEAFAATFERIDARRDRFVISGKFMTSGGAAPTLDMMLHLIGALHGADLSARVANALIYDPAQGPAQPQARAATARLLRRHPVVARAVAMMEAHLEEPLPIADLAARLRLSPRHLETRFQQALGQSPKRFYLDLRLSEARRLAQDSALPVSQIAQATGFAAQAGLSRAFRARFGQSIRDLRAAQ